MGKPFSLQSPEQIAKEYGGNKEKIRQAMAMGLVDPTAGVLGGMFIDRMRSAQVMEAGQQPSVAQQVLGGGQPQMPPMGAPPAPPQGMAPPQQGMGAPPQQMPMAPPPQDMGMAPPQGMAEGGLATLPVPDAMFDEPGNGGFDDGYAGGGMIAFADGGGVDAARLRRALLMQESGGDYGVTNAEGSGAMGAYQFMPDTARALAKRIGKEYRPDLMTGDKGRSKEGRAYQESLMDAQMKDILAYSGGDIGKAGAYHFAGPNTKGHGPKTRKYEEDILRRYSGSKDTGEMPERDIGTAEGRSRSVEDQFQNLLRRFGPTEKEQDVDAKRMARAEEMASDEYQEKERRYDDGMLMAQIGFGAAASNSPYALQAFGDAINASLPGARASRKERKALKDRALDVMGQINDKSRKENLQLFGIALDMEKEGKQQTQFERELTSRETIANNEILGRLAAATAKDTIKPNSFEAYVETFYKDFITKGYPENQARQFAYGAAKIAMEKINKEYGTTGVEGALGLTENETSGATNQKNVNTFDYDSLKD